MCATGGAGDLAGVGIWSFQDFLDSDNDAVFPEHHDHVRQADSRTSRTVRYAEETYNDLTRQTKTGAQLALNSPEQAALRTWRV